MSTAYESSGRTRQKARTRAALVAGARELIAEGGHPSVERAADRAGISRTTAYRYFRNRRELLSATFPALDTASLFGPDAPSDPLDRLEIVLERIGCDLLEHEAELRAQLRLSLEGAAQQDLPLRQGLALNWIEEALSPLAGRHGSAEHTRLVLAVRAAYGIEPLVWLTGVGKLPSAEAIALMRESARTLVRAAMA